MAASAARSVHSPRRHIVAQQSKEQAKSFEAGTKKIESEPLEPIGTIVRELKRPDGTTLSVEVPVYPPFKLKERSAAAPNRKNRS